MSPLVVDASLVIFALTEAKTNEVLRRRLRAPRVLHAPALIDYEVGNAIRGLVLGKKIEVADAEVVRRDFSELSINRHPGEATAPRSWALRDNFNAYDASYIGLAELLGAPLLTGDTKLRGAHDAEVIVYPADD